VGLWVIQRTWAHEFPKNLHQGHGLKEASWCQKLIGGKQQKK